jgi:hypothetical protein
MAKKNGVVMFLRNVVFPELYVLFIATAGRTSEPTKYNKYEGGHV